MGVYSPLNGNRRTVNAGRLDAFGRYAVFATTCIIFLFLGAMYCLNSCQSSMQLTSSAAMEAIDMTRRSGCDPQTPDFANIKIDKSNQNHRDQQRGRSWFDTLFGSSSSSVNSIGYSRPARRLSAFLVVLVLSSASNMERRSTIRQTWLKDVHADVLHLFAIGSVSSLDDDEKRTLQSEIARFQDVLYLSEVNDTYAGLTKKVLHAFTWIDSNVDFSFLLKADDDTFARLDDMAAELESLNSKDRFYWGFFDGRATVFKRGQWAEHDYVLCDRYLPYALGGGYVLSADMIRFVAANRRYLKLHRSEDVSVGTWLAAVDVRRVHDPRFDTEYRSRGCSNSYLVMHKQSVDLMREKHWSLQERGKLCVNEQRVRQSYEYNWKVPPSQCCVRNDSKIP